jgi:hypothetical protein
VRITTRSFPCSYCGCEPAPALTTLCAGCLSTATELVRGVLVEDGLSIDVGRLMDAGQPGDEEAFSRVQLVCSLAARLAAAERQIDAATDALMDHGYMDGDQDLREAVEAAVAAAAEAGGAREVLTDVGYMSGGRGLVEAVCDVITESVDRGQRYFRERQYRVNVAAVASRVILRAHSESHAGSVATCPTCAADWAVVEEASGVRAPGN